MRKTYLFAIVTVLVLSLAGSVMAGQMGQLDKLKKKAEEAVEGMTFTGEVSAVDAEAHTFTVKGEDSKEMTFHVSEEAKVRIDGEQKALADLAEGAQVSVTYMTKDDKNTAMDIKTK
jgi:Cu/Ag efflux protein CusF